MFTLHVYRHGACDPDLHEFASRREYEAARKALRRVVRRHNRRPPDRWIYGDLVLISGNDTLRHRA